MPQTKSPKTCWFEVCDIPLENFRLPKDCRKWKAAAGARQHLFMHLAKFANKDGTSARPSIPTLMKRTGFSHGKTCYILDDLKTLGFWEKVGRNGWNGTTIRALKVPIVGVQDSEVAVQDSQVAVQPRVDATCPTNLSYKPVNQINPIDRLREGFTKATGKVMGVEKKDIPAYTDIIREHGEEAFLSWVIYFANVNHVWYRVINPSKLYLSKSAEYLALARLKPQVKEYQISPTDWTDEFQPTEDTRTPEQIFADRCSI